MLQNINENEDLKKKKQPKDLSSLIDTYKEAVDTFQEGDYTPKGRTYAYHTMKNLAPLIERELGNRGSEETTRLSGEYGLEGQKLQNIGGMEQTRERNVGSENVQKLSDIGAMNRLRTSNQAERVNQNERLLATMEENRRNRESELKKPIYERGTSDIGIPIEYTNINTPEQRNKSISAGTFDKSDEDFFMGKVPSNDTTLDIKSQELSSIPEGQRTVNDVMKKKRQTNRIALQNLNYQAQQ